MNILADEDLTYSIQYFSGVYKMADRITEELLDELQFTKTLDDFLELTNSRRTLSEYLNSLLVQKKLKKSEVIRKSMLNSTFAYQIFSGDRRASRNKILQIAFAMELSLKETQTLLNISCSNGLYCRDRRDAIIIYCIAKHKTLGATDDILYKFNEATICGD